MNSFRYSTAFEPNYITSSSYYQNKTLTSETDENFSHVSVLSSIDFHFSSMPTPYLWPFGAQQLSWSTVRPKKYSISGQRSQIPRINGTRAFTSNTYRRYFPSLILQTPTFGWTLSITAIKPLMNSWIIISTH